MDELANRIFGIIQSKPGLKAMDIARQLGVERKVINSALYGRLKGKVIQDKNYRWYLKDGAIRQKNVEAQAVLNTPLARLCRYYLDCLSHDDVEGVSEFASSLYDDLKYVELDTFPMSNQDGNDPFDSDSGRRLLGRIRRDRNRQMVFLGYPVRLHHIRSRRGWEGFMVEPILLFPFQDAANRNSKPVLTDDLPQINFKALRGLTDTSDSSLMEEAIQLSLELGLGNSADDQPELDELLNRLRDIRSDWDWREEIAPDALSNGPGISDLNQQGIFNRAILIAAERSPYTKGLESELGMLQLVEENNYCQTALGSWIIRQTIDSPPADQQSLLEVVPLNSEQRQAVRQAISNPLTIITGPPGTGKSQIVTSILINAAYQGKTVLFASKNNKAVDVVETRVNAFGPRPVLLRLGANQYQGRLAEYLVKLLAATATTDDLEHYQEFNGIHIKIMERAENLDAEIRSLINLRNEVDQLEQRVEITRREVGKDIFFNLKDIDGRTLAEAVEAFQSAVEGANKAEQRFLTRLFWILIRNARFTKLLQAGGSFQNFAQLIGAPVPNETPDSKTIEDWVNYSERLATRWEQLSLVQKYFQRLADLSEVPSLEVLSKERKDLTEYLAQNSENLWQVWLRLQPARMGPDQRRLLGDYSALLQMIVSANEQNQQLSRDVFRRYYQLFPKVTSILPCWAVTSLSARGRIPFDPNFFDLLIIDEASQCDIASALPLLYRARRVVIIGDPMQLRHISTLSKQQDQQLLSKQDLLKDYPGWAYSTRSLFDLASGLCRSEDIVALRDHHRSHADIIEFSNETFYEGRLRVATNYDRLKLPRHDEPAVRWVNVRGRTSRPGTGGAVNEEEAQAVVKEIERLISQGYRGGVGVVSPFRAQANKIRDLVFSNSRLSSRIAEMDFLVDTVHKFQGDERDVMIFSPVLSTGISQGSLGFLKNNPNLFNVAITRARAALIVVGNKEVILNCGVDYLARFAAYTDRLRIHPSEKEQLAGSDLGPEYPPVSNPELVSEWEHIFYRALYLEGIRAIPQYAVEKYILDFAIVVGQSRLNIEIDGERYHRNWDGELCRRDQIRNQRLMELGWDIMRFWVYQVRDDLDKCIRKVNNWVGHNGTKT